LAETFGITRDPTSNYMIVMKYYENGNLYQYLDRSNGILSWKDIIDILWGIAEGLEKIHSEGKVHKTFTEEIYLWMRKSLQILVLVMLVFVDHGVLPYITPEVLRGENYTAVSHEYFTTGKRPWYNRAHDINLAKDICNNERFEILEDCFYAGLMWGNEPEKRSTASYLNEI
jgi:hypothetical protein